MYNFTNSVVIKCFNLLNVLLYTHLIKVIDIGLVMIENIELTKYCNKKNLELLVRERPLIT